MDLKQKTQNNINKIPKDILDRTILLTYGGSHAYGTNVAGSDIDLRGVCLETPKELIGLQNFEQYLDNVNDITIYGFNKIIKLLINCNPNVIEILGNRDESIFIKTELGQKLIDNIDLFISQRCIHSFCGYSIAQLRRLQNALSKDYNKKDKEKHVLKTLNNQFEHFKNNYENFEDGSIKLYIDKSEKVDFENEIFMDIILNHYPVRDFKGIYSELASIIKDFESLNHRNNKKTIASLEKHSMHLIRLNLMLIDILKGNGIQTYRKDKELLLDIRNGKYKFEEIFEMVDEYEKEIDLLKKNTNLPKKPNFKKIEKFVIEVNKKAIEG
jgi:predicted nucleotidyltransferase